MVYQFSQQSKVFLTAMLKRAIEAIDDGRIGDAMDLGILARCLEDGLVMLYGHNIDDEEFCVNFNLGFEKDASCVGLERFLLTGKTSDGEVQEDLQPEPPKKRTRRKAKAQG